MQREDAPTFRQQLTSLVNNADQRSIIFILMEVNYVRNLTAYLGHVENRLRQLERVPVPRLISTPFEITLVPESASPTLTEPLPPTQPRH